MLPKREESLYGFAAAKLIKTDSSKSPRFKAMGSRLIEACKSSILFPSIEATIHDASL